MESEKREHVLFVRLNAGELAKVALRASQLGFPVGVWGRNVVLNAAEEAIKVMENQRKRPKGAKQKRASSRAVKRQGHRSTKRSSKRSRRSK